MLPGRRREAEVPLERWQRLSPLVVRVMGLNPGSHTLAGTNTYLIGSGPSRILLDTGEGRQGYLPLLEEAMAGSGCTSLSAVCITHLHYDHIGGLADLRASPKHGGVAIHRVKLEEDSDKQLRKEAERRRTVIMSEQQQEGGSDAEMLSSCDHDIADGTVFSVEGAHLKAIRTPGHTDDSVCFMLEEEGAIFSGDCVLGGRTTTITCHCSLLSSLTALEALKPKSIYPGHGPFVSNALVKLRSDKNHRSQIEKGVLKQLQSEKTVVSQASVAAAMYGPLELPAPLYCSAVRNVELAIIKLQKDGTVHAVEAPTGSGDKPYICLGQVD